MAGAVVIRVIGSGAIGEVIQSELSLHRLELVEELLFAVKASVRVVARVSLQLNLVCRNLDQACAE